MKYDIIIIDKRPPIGMDMNEYHQYLKNRMYLQQQYSYSGDIEVISTRENLDFIMHLVKLNKIPDDFSVSYQEFDSDDDATLWFELKEMPNRKY